MFLGKEACPPSSFGLFANGTTKLRNKSYLSLAAILSAEKRVALSSRLQRNNRLKEICKNLDPMVPLFSTTVALFTNASRNRVDVKV